MVETDGKRKGMSVTWKVRWEDDDDEMGDNYLLNGRMESRREREYCVW